MKIFEENHMLKGISALLLMGILVLGAISPATSAFAESDKVQMLIGFNGKPDVSLIKQNGGHVKDNFYPFINVVSAELPSKAIEGLKQNPKISYIESDLIATIHNHPSATGEYLNVWGVDHINADLAHASYDGSNVNVVVIDTGINYGHPDIGGIAGGWDFVNNDNDPADDHGHGTHVSGTIAGVAGNGGIIGVSPNVNLYGVKVLDSSGSGSYSNVINGIMWAANYGMDVANLSLGGGASTSLCDAVTAATNNGVLVIASAGNSGNPKGKGTNTGYPATCEDAIAVAATTQNDSRASFSSTGPAVEISAPGSGIYSSILGTGYGTWSGTSMAAPHVSGVAALVKDANSSLTPQELRSILQTTAIDLGDVGRDTKFGFGLVNTLDAIAAAGSNPISPDPDFIISTSQNSFSVNVGDIAETIISISPTNNYDGTVDLSSSRSSDEFSSSSITVGQNSNLVLDTSQAGSFTITVTGYDSLNDISHSATINLIVNDTPNPPPNTLNSEIVLDVDAKMRFNNLLVTVFATDENSSPISNVFVQLTLSRDGASWNYSGTTDELGKVSWKLMKALTDVEYSAQITNWDSTFTTGEPIECGLINSNNLLQPCA